MANFTGSYTSPYTSPTFVYDISYSQTGRAGGSATYSVTVTARMTSSSSTFGFALEGQVVIGNVSQTIRFKNNETWSGTTGHSFTFTLTPTGVSDSGGTITARFYGTRPGAEGDSGKIDTGGDETVTLSVWNTKPSLSGTVSTNPSGTIGENISTITVSWPSATDPQGGTIYYEVLRELNQSGSWSTLSTSVTTTSYVDTIGAGNQGQIIRYAVRARDSSGLVSDPYIYSSYVTKNTFTTATLSSSDTIIHGDTSIVLSKSGGYNTSGSTTFSSSLSSIQLTVYNPTSTPTAVAIKTSVTGTDTYVLLSDIKNVFRSAGFKGTLNFTLTTTNAYGTSGTSTKGIPVDLTTSPSSFASAVTTANTYSIGGNNYYIPDRKAILISWGACTDLVDSGAITYDIQVSYDGGSSYSTIKTGNATTSYTTTLPQVTSTKYCKFNIIANTSYGTSRSLTLISSIELHYYNPPTIVFNDVVRTQTQATVSGIINYNTSIVATLITVSTVSPSTYYTTSGGLITGLTATVYTALSRMFTATFNIGDTVTCSFNFTAQDSGGIACGTTASTQSKTVPVYTPALALRSNGIGINALPDGTNRVVIGGSVKATAFNGPLTGNVTGTASNANLLDNIDSTGFARSGFGLGTIATDISGQDIHINRLSGWYMGYGCANAPDGSWWWYEIINHNGVWCSIKASAFYSLNLYIKTQRDSGWTGWERMIGSSEVTSSVLAGKIVQRDVNGYIYGNYFNSNRGSENAAAAQYIYDNGDGWMRKKDLSVVRSEILVGIGRTPAYTYSTTVPNGAYVTITHNLGYYPMLSWSGTCGNITMSRQDTSVNALQVYVYSTGGATFAGKIYMY
jgi:hypothetical protein